MIEFLNSCVFFTSSHTGFNVCTVRGLFVRKFLPYVYGFDFYAGLFLRQEPFTLFSSREYSVTNFTVFILLQNCSPSEFILVFQLWNLARTSPCTIYKFIFIYKKISSLTKTHFLLILDLLFTNTTLNDRHKRIFVTCLFSQGKKN